MSDTTIRAVFRHGCFIPFLRHKAFVAETYKEGDQVFLDIQQERSTKTHGHQFAWISDAFDSLPERLHNAPFAQSPETLRKHALIMTGFCEVATIPCGSKAVSERVAAHVSVMAVKLHGYAIVSTSGPMVVVKTPMSQSSRAMGKEAFQKSKEAILNWIGNLLETNPEDLEKGTQND